MKISLYVIDLPVEGMSMYTPWEDKTAAPAVTPPGTSGTPPTD
jgi:hypothetical protein